MIRRLRLYRLMASVFHSGVKPAVMLAVLTGFRCVDAAASVLDEIFNREYRQEELDRPIFIIGNPRSGTTFLHRLLLGAGDLAAMELWEMLLPAVTARKVLGGIVPRLGKVNPAQYHASDAHETSLRGIETDDLAWFFHTLDGPFEWAYFQAWRDSWGSRTCDTAFGIGENPAGADERFWTFNEKVWRKTLLLKAKSRVLVKSSMMTFRLQTLLKRHPDARLIYVVRDPVDTIPSGMSLLSGALENAFGIWNVTDTEDRDRWLENLYQASVAMFTGFHDQYVAGTIPAANLLVVRYPDLLSDLENTIAAVLEFIEVPPSAQFTREVAVQAEKQRNRVSGHEYTPDQFGLTAGRIETDLADIYATFDLPFGDRPDETHHGNDAATEGNR